MYRLEEDVAAAYAANQKICFKEAGSALAADHITHTANGYLYARAPRTGKKTLAKIHARHTRRIDAYLKKGIPYFEGAIQPIIEDRLAELRGQRAQATDLSDLVAYLDACIQASGYIMGNLHWAQIRPGSFSQMGFSDVYHELTGRPVEEAFVFLQAIQNRMTRLVAWLQKLARMAQGNATLSRLLAERRFDVLSGSKARANPAVKAFQDELKRMLRIYGLRTGRGYGATSEFTTPTWNMDPSLPLEIIASYTEQDLDRLAALEHQARRDRQNAVKRVRRMLAPMPRKLKQFNKALEDATFRVRILENHNYWMEQCTYGTLREAIFEVGTALVQENLMDDPDDIIHFSVGELKAIARNKARADQRELINIRIETYKRRERMRPPRTLGKVPDEKESNTSEEAEEKTGLQGNIIQGESASGGQVTGPARVVLPGKKRPQIHPGDILVARNVGPEWTPVFALIGGLVLDEGVLYQHAALVAREYGIPAVLNAKCASSTITEGQTIGVNGDRGFVALEV
jgi:phosphoenolpyruvate synthase/pyruvate phosphate dikinase